MKHIPPSELSELHADVCVVGSGPVGLPLSIRLAEKGLHVLLLEAGSNRPSGTHTSGVDAEFAAGLEHAPMPLAVCRAFGGTSWLWGGRCVPLDSIDFAARHWQSNDGWPIKEGDVAPYYQAAAQALGCGPAKFVDPSPFATAGGLNLETLERWCDMPLLPSVRAPDSLPERLSVCLGATVTGLSLSSDGARVTGAQVTSAGRKTLFTGAPIFVLACGGLETARLMLNVQAEHPFLFGGADGALGRYYMGHLSGHIARIILNDPRSARFFDYRGDKFSSTRRRMTLDSDIQTAKELPNIAFTPDNPRMSDPAHGSGVLSAIFLMLCTPIVGPRLISEAIRRMQMTEKPRLGRHFRNIVLDLPRVMATGIGLLCQKFAIRRRKPHLFLHSRNGQYPLHFHSEHIGRCESRVWLGERRSPEGLRQLVIDQRFTVMDADGIVRAHEALDEALRSSNLGRLEFFDPPDRRRASVLAQAGDGFHQMGTVRMASDRNGGVVNSDCQVFDLNNLFVAGTSVFCTSGQANPTFYATALGLRLADHIAAKFASITKSQ